jgi:hypothetical protein
MSEVPPHIFHPNAEGATHFGDIGVGMNLTLKRILNVM